MIFLEIDYTGHQKERAYRAYILSSLHDPLSK